jgi:hypothetical protein
MGIAAMEEFMAIGGMEELGESAVVRAWVQSLHKASCGGQNGKKKAFSSKSRSQESVLTDLGYLGKSWD